MINGKLKLWGVKVKRFLSLIIALAVVFNFCFISGGFVTEATGESYIPTPVDLNSRDDFSFGVNTHPSTYEAYSEVYLEQQVNAVARMGSKWIRFGIHSMPQGDEWEYPDTLVGLCNKYGLKIVLIIYPETTVSLEYITIYCETFAYRYNGEDSRGYVDIIQVWNEIDDKLMKAKYGSGSASGVNEDHYFTIPVEGAADLPEYLEYYQAAEKGVHSSNSRSKFMVNFAASHCGMISYFLRNGLKIDVVGWDLYTNYPNDRGKSAEDLVENYYNVVEEKIYNKYHIPFLICETNVAMQTLTVEERKAAELESYRTLIDNLYLAYARPWIKGAILYELIDESQSFSGGDTNPEASYGLIKNPNPGGVGILDRNNEKPVYKEMQRLLGGNSNLAVIERSTVNLKPYEKLVVETADDSGIGGFNDVTADSLANIDWGSGDVGLEEIENEPDADGLDVISDLIKKIKTTETLYEMPWLIIALASGGLLLAGAAVVLLYIFISKKKSKKNTQ